MTVPDQPLLQALTITKAFGPVKVLEGVSFDLRPGEVHTLMGENGAGKSTLMKIIAGVHTPDAGRILLDGNEVRIASPHAAQELGIALIHQEPLSFPDLSVAENIFIGRKMPTTKWGSIDWGKIYGEARRLLGLLGVSLDPKVNVKGLSIADQQMVELAAALAQNARVLLMDEPTAALTPSEVAELFRIVRELTAKGVAIVFISHRLEEVFAISDRITVLRDGQFVGTRQKSDTNREEIIRMMVGRPLEALYDKTTSAPGEALLKVEGLTRRGRFEDISFQVRRGEIVGLAGLVGAGRTDVAQSIFGIGRRDRGRVWIDGREVKNRSPKSAIAEKIAYVPEDRAQHGVLLPFSIASNIGLANPDKVSALGWLLGGREKKVANGWRDRLKIRSRDVRQSARELSGGNQQKVVLGKWLETGPDVLLLDEPTRGIDVGAKAEVHHLMGELARQGKAILMISSDLPEVLAMSDRVLVMKEGKLTGEFARGDATQEKIMAAATAASIGTRQEKRQAPAKSRFNLMRFRELGVALVVVLLFIIAAVKDRRFIQPDILRKILLYIPLIVVVAMGQMMVIISRNIDLSVGSVLAFAAIVVGFFLKAHPAFPLSVAALFAVLIGGGLGLVNGLLVAYLRVPAIIATLGALSAYRGLVFIYSKGDQVDPNFIPERLIRLSQYPTGVPWIVIFATLLAGVAYLFLKYARLGREIFAIGSNPTAAVLRGIPVKRNLAIIYVIAGALSGLAGLMYASRFGFINPSKTGDGFELIVISAVVIGGTSVFGGSGSVLGTILGCVLIGAINIGLSLIEHSAFYQLAIYGGAILIAAMIDRGIQRLSERTA